VTGVVSGLSDYGEMTGRTKGSGPRATLIVCPLSTMSSWLVGLSEQLDLVRLDCVSFVIVDVLYKIRRRRR